MAINSFYFYFENGGFKLDGEVLIELIVYLNFLSRVVAVNPNKEK